MNSTRALLGWLALAAALAASAKADTPPEGWITEVELRPANLLARGEFTKLREFYLPGPPAEVSLEATRNNLLRTGRFSDVTWELKDKGKWKKIIFTLTPHLFVRNIVWQGRTQVSKAELRSGMTLQPYMGIADGALDQAIKEIQDIYEWQGFPRPDIDARTVSAGEAGATRVVFIMNEKPLPPLTAMTIHYSGDLGWWQNIRLKSRLALRKSKANRNGINPERFKQLLREEERRFRSLGFRGAEFTIEMTPEVAGPNEPREVTLSINLGDRMKLALRHVGFFHKRNFLAAARKRNLPMTEQRVATLAKQLQDELVEKGYLEAEVETRYSTKKGRNLVVLSAEKGPRTHVSQVRFDGNEAASSEELRDVSGLRPPRFFNLIKSRPTPKNLAEAVKTLQGHYATFGYPEAQVNSALAAGDDKPRSVSFDIEEGIRWINRVVWFDGVSWFTSEELRRLANLPMNRRYRWAEVENAARIIKEAYWAKGFSDVTVTPAVDHDGEGNVEITYDITEGTKYMLGANIISGNYKTSASTVLRLQPIPSGKPFDLKPVAELQQDLYDLDVFDSVTLRTIERPNLVPPEKSIVIDVSEARTGVMEFGLDLNTDRGFELAGKIGDRNLAGRALGATAYGLYGRERSNIALELAQPYFFGTRLTNRLRLSYGDDRTHDGYNTSTFAIEETVSREFGASLSTALTYRYEAKGVFDVDENLSSATEYPTSQRIASLTPEVIWDTRDNPFDPATGYRVSTQLKISEDFLGADLTFYRQEIDVRRYVDLSDGFIVAAAFRGGRLWAVDGIGQVPLDERFYLGGANTNRGFRENDLGPRADHGPPIGGMTYILANVEVRFPLWGSLRGGVFADIGNDYADTPEPPYVRPSAGFGLRLQTPFGPLRGDVGFNVNPRNSEDSFALHLAIGHAF